VFHHATEFVLGGVSNTPEKLFRAVILSLLFHGASSVRSFSVFRAAKILLIGGVSNATEKLFRVDFSSSFAKRG
jgi:hypothetical protein